MAGVITVKPAIVSVDLCEGCALDQTIDQRQTIQWAVTDALDHTVTSLASPETWVASGTLNTTVTPSFSHQFNDAGSESYQCDVHTGDTGVITVNAVALGEPATFSAASGLTTSLLWLVLLALTIFFA
jgi:hypothetical protein